MTLPAINPDKPTVSTSGFGRVFFAGGSTLYYSPVLESIGDLGRCYQVNDPTSDEISDLLETDGGALTLKDAGDIVDITAYRVGILVFTDRGVWYVYNNERGFRSTEYVVSKISEQLLKNVGAYVEAQGVLYFCTEDDINIIVPNEFDNLTVKSITEETILTKYKDFSSKGDITIAYNNTDKIVWFYNGASEALQFDQRVGSWYPQEFVGSRTVNRPLYRNQEMLFLNYPVGFVPTTFYNFATLTDDLFQDFGTDQTAYLLSGYETLGKFSHKKAITYGSFFFNKTETQITGFDDGTQTFSYDYPSACKMQVRWDFDKSNAYSKWVGVVDGIGSGKSMDLYKPMKRGFLFEETYPVDFDTGESIISKKVKLRGNGKAVQFYFEAQPQKDLQLLGYSVEFTMRGKQ